MIKLALMTAMVAFAPIAACSQTAPDTSPRTESPTVTNSTQATSNADFATTNARLKNAIESRGLTLFTVVDHAAGAAKVGQTLAPNTLYIFGNPQAGTPLMLADPAMGLHLPLKANVREQDGKVIVTVSDIRALASEPAPVVDKVAGALGAILKDATGT